MKDMITIMRREHVRNNIVMTGHKGKKGGRNRQPTLPPTVWNIIQQPNKTKERKKVNERINLYKLREPRVKKNI